MTDCMRMTGRATATGAPGTSPEPSAALVRSLAGAMRDALRSGAVGRMLVPPRETVEDAAGAKFISMPAVSPDHDLYVNKVATIVASPVPGRRSTVTSVVPVFAASTGRFLGTLDGDTVTNLKCAAVTALVTDRCAAPGSRVLGIIGSGVQARQQFLGVSAVRDLAEVRVWSRDPARAAAFARDIEETAAAAGQKVGVVVAGSAEHAARGADILSTATTSVRPLPIPAGLPAHVHINCMGAHTTASREVSAELLRSNVVIVEDLRTAIAEAGESHAGAIELDALFAPGAGEFTRQGTIFASTGCAYLDLITCAHLAGRDDFEGFRLTGAAP
ncbi:ornithine cyclodeaminase family protein [Streptomyces roseoverticillatus]|uniref:ornithine cyclodeaminase family protein n=1 Tax=Streptomyces roseoverticillatus TaxID=66429 RepID=UPI000ACF1DDF|nr:ornithine cyclodeaminase family protein [Streptomyces roseoverticillatus]